MDMKACCDARRRFNARCSFQDEPECSEGSLERARLRKLHVDVPGRASGTLASGFGSVSAGPKPKMASHSSSNASTLFTDAVVVVVVVVLSAAVISVAAEEVVAVAVVAVVAIAVVVAVVAVTCEDGP